MPARATLVPKPIPREAINDLFEQAMVGWAETKDQPGAWLDALERFTRLIEAEGRGQLLNAAHRRETRSQYTGLPHKKRMPNFG